MARAEHSVTRENGAHRQQKRWDYIYTDGIIFIQCVHLQLSESFFTITFEPLVAQSTALNNVIFRCSHFVCLYRHEIGRVVQKLEHFRFFFDFQKMAKRG